MQSWPKDGLICQVIVSCTQITQVRRIGRSLWEGGGRTAFCIPGDGHGSSWDALCWGSFSEDSPLLEPPLSTAYT